MNAGRDDRCASSLSASNLGAALNVTSAVGTTAEVHVGHAARRTAFFVPRDLPQVPRKNAEESAASIRNGGGEIVDFNSLRIRVRSGARS
jgi:hypothetical protein